MKNYKENEISCTDAPFKFRAGPGFQQSCFLLFILSLLNVIFLNNELVWDDPVVVNFHGHWSADALLGPYAIGNGSFWRPLAVVTIVVPYLLGLPVWLGKLISVVIFFAEGCLTIAIVDQYFQSRQVTSVRITLLVLAAVIGLHPLFAETTLWISARADLLLGTLVMAGVLCLVVLHRRQLGNQAPPSIRIGLIATFLLMWALCASKDTGIIWAGLAVLTLSVIAWKSNPDWKKFWGYEAASVTLAMLTYLALRMHVLTGAAGIAEREASSLTDRWCMFVEFMTRALIEILLPVFDQAPFKAQGWFSAVSLPQTLIALIAVAIIVMVMFRWLLRSDRLALWLACCAVIVLVVHGCIAAFYAQSIGSLIAARYVAPSALFLFIAFAIAATIRIEQRNNEKEGALWRAPDLALIGALIILVLAQSVSIWTTSRLTWSSNLGLWEGAWNHGPHQRGTAITYSTALLEAGHWKQSRDIAVAWIDDHPLPYDRLKLCKFFNTAITADLIGKDVQDASQLSSRATDIGWCNPDLAIHIADFRIKKDCQSVLLMLDRTLQEDAKTKVTKTLGVRKPDAKGAGLTTKRPSRSTLRGSQ